jgi:hypothetical protein
MTDVNDPRFVYLVPPGTFCLLLDLENVNNRSRHDLSPRLRFGVVEGSSGIVLDGRVQIS